MKKAKNLIIWLTSVVLAVVLGIHNTRSDRIEALKPEIPFTGDVCAVLLYVEDAESAWTAEEVAAFTQTCIQPGLAFLADQAEEYGVDLTLTTLSYMTDESNRICYDGVINPGFVVREEEGRKLVYPDTSAYTMDILERVAGNWGFASREEMDRELLERAGAEKLKYVVIPNKGGWSMAAREKNFCCLFPRDWYEREAAETTFPHEFLHLFSAEDLYLETRMDGTTLRENRAQMTEQLHENAIMHGGFSQLDDAIVCGYTAYRIGWLQTLPKEYRSRKWYS